MTRAQLETTLTAEDAKDAEERQKDVTRLGSEPDGAMDLM
jgi:hypothetical protein